jgi:hypothetical protein
LDLSTTSQEENMNTAVGKKLLALVIGVLAMTLAFAPASYAGEDDGDDGGSTTKRVATSGSGSGDSGSASGGVAAGVGGMAVGSGQDMLVPALLTGGGILMLTAAGGIAVRRRGDLEALPGVAR